MATTARPQLLVPSLLTGDWHIVPSRSELGFLTRIMFGLIAVRGRYDGFQGELHVNQAGDASGFVRVDAETISTGIKKRDRHLRSSDFFAVERHPHMSFELDSLTPGRGGAVTVSGTLHIRDRVLRIDPAVAVFPIGPDSLRIDAEFEVDHHAAGFDFKRLPRKVLVQAALTLERLG